MKYSFFAAPLLAVSALALAACTPAEVVEIDSDEPVEVIVTEVTEPEAAPAEEVVVTDEAPTKQRQSRKRQLMKIPAMLVKNWLAKPRRMKQGKLPTLNNLSSHFSLDQEGGLAICWPAFLPW